MSNYTPKEEDYILSCQQAMFSFEKRKTYVPLTPKNILFDVLTFISTTLDKVFEPVSIELTDEEIARLDTIYIDTNE